MPWRGDRNRCNEMAVQAGTRQGNTGRETSGRTRVVVVVMVVVVVLVVMVVVVVVVEEAADSGRRVTWSWWMRRS